MKTSRKINSKSFLNYKLCLLILIFVIIQTTSGKDIVVKNDIPKFVYNDSKEFVDAINNCADWLEKDMIKNEIVPREIIIAQSVIESDYGKSRFSKVANNLFGVRTYDLNKPHIKPLNSPESNFGLKKYETKCDSVKDYIKTLNKGFAFSEFRQVRQKMIENDNIDIFILVETLKNYAANPNYVNLIKKTIKSYHERISATNSYN